MKINEPENDFMQPLLCEEPRDLWMDKYSFITRSYSFKLSVQNHPAPGSDQSRLSCVGITIKVKDCDKVETIHIKQIPAITGGADFYKDEKRILVHYDRGDINNIIQDIKAKKPLFVVYGQFSKESGYPEKKYVAIENDPVEWT